MAAASADGSGAVAPPAKRSRSSVDPARVGIVDMDVAGTFFRASASTLRMSPYFRALLENRESGGLGSAIDEGAVFVDRCPKLFAKVLQFLRTSRAYAESEVEEAELREEFRYFGLDPDAVQGGSVEEVVVQAIHDPENIHQSNQVQIVLLASAEILQKVEGTPTCSNWFRNSTHFPANCLLWRDHVWLPTATVNMSAAEERIYHVPWLSFVCEVEHAAQTLRGMGFTEVNRCSLPYEHVGSTRTSSKDAVKLEGTSVTLRRTVMS